ncbi:hypothetical protein ACKRLN_07110 [Anaerococcus sp. DFU013_CI05]|uniref:hypothetical protein n=1 Tax=unclassified Anaerococcus TaxID=2614126 RepID=UPI0019335153|nr:hypothetical protein [Anaerococcus sp. mt242]MBM0046823.1 hypothetical protein [Anaerococcus sp. mt242]
MKYKKLLVSALSASILFGGLASSASADNINTNSGFYRSRRTRQAYLNLSADQRSEIDTINTNNNTQITLKEVKAHGKYRLPIVKGQNYLYAFMDDRNNNGMVGENDISAIGTSPVKAVETIEEIDEDISNRDQEINEAVEEIIETTTEVEKPVEEEIEIQDPISNISEQQLDKLQNAIDQAEETIAGAKILMDTMPQLAEKNGPALNQLIEKQNTIISRANAILKANGR